MGSRDIFVIPCSVARFFDRGIAGKHLRDRWALVAEEAGGEILGEKRIGFRAGLGIFDIPAMIPLRTCEGDQRGGKLQLRIIAA